MAATASKPSSRKTAGKSASRNGSKPAASRNGSKPAASRNGSKSAKSAAPKPASKPRSARAAARQAGSGTKRKRASTAGNAGRGPSKGVAAAVSPKRAAATAGKKVIGKAGKAALSALVKRSLRTGVQTGARALRAALETGRDAGRQAMETGLSKTAETRPPIQAAVDVAAPLSVVWTEWMTFDAFTEGLHKIEDVERDGGELIGHTAGPESREWRAEIVDEREEESFAWRSVEGTDCAGLVTFHRLSERLTRVDADLDVVPTNPVEAVLLSLRLPTRRAQRELQRFKARVEFINPDAYEDEDSAEAPPDTDQDGGETDAAEEEGGS